MKPRTAARTVTGVHLNLRYAVSRCQTISTEQSYAEVKLYHSVEPLNGGIFLNEQMSVFLSVYGGVSYLDRS